MLETRRTISYFTFNRSRASKESFAWNSSSAPRSGFALSALFAQHLAFAVSCHGSPAPVQGLKSLTLVGIECPTPSWRTPIEHHGTSHAYAVLVGRASAVARSPAGTSPFAC